MTKAPTGPTISLEPDMPTESDLRAALRETAAHRAAPHTGVQPSPRPLDADTIIRRARRRRTPKQVLLGSATVCALAAVAFVGVNGIPGLTGVGSSNSGALSDADGAPEAAMSGPDSTERDDDSQGPAVNGSDNPCGIDVADPNATSGPLTLVIDGLKRAPSGDTVTGVVTVTNPITERVTAVVSAAPTLTVSEDGTARWDGEASAFGPGRVVDLAPGESVVFEVDVALVACSAEDAQDDQAPLPPGTAGPTGYDVSVALAVAPAGGGSVWLVQSPWTRVTDR